MKGFTLVELLVLIAIIGTLLATVLYSFEHNRSHEGEQKQQINQW